MNEPEMGHRQVKTFIGFIFVSGIGWVLDMLSYTVFTQLFIWTPAFSNFLSSMLGVTYVWSVSLDRLFNRSGYGKSIFLPIYWGYQTLSIFAYSLLIGAVVISQSNVLLSQSSMLPPEVAAKILITPINLLTNFVFMTFLTKFMKKEIKR
jgi:putative flippase GtrA